MNIHRPNISASLMPKSSAALIACFSDALFNHGMDIDEIRRQRLEMIIQETGTVAAVATRLGVSPAQVSQWRNQSIDPKTGKRRVMHRNSARRLEAMWSKPANWMDTPLEDAIPGSEEHDLAARFEKLPVEFRAFLVRQGEELISKLSEAGDSIQIALDDGKAVSSEKTEEYAQEKKRKKK